MVSVSECALVLGAASCTVTVRNPHQDTTLRHQPGQCARNIVGCAQLGASNRDQICNLRGISLEQRIDHLCRAGDNPRGQVVSMIWMEVRELTLSVLGCLVREKCLPVSLQKGSTFVFSRKWCCGGPPLELCFLALAA